MQNAVPFWSAATICALGRAKKYKMDMSEGLERLNITIVDEEKYGEAMKAAKTASDVNVDVGPTGSANGG